MFHQYVFESKYGFTDYPLVDDPELEYVKFNYDEYNDTLYEGQMRINE